MTFVIAEPCVDVLDRSCVDSAAFFAGVGSPGGAANLPKGTAPDPAAVTALPLRASD
jgi:hypothetical protein